METMKKTTVVIPNYNGIKYLERCLEALFAESADSAACHKVARENVQTEEFEVLVIDNGSKDGSEHVVSDMAKCFEAQHRSFPVRQISYDHNTGFCAAHDAGN